jgi:hypothetical protein
MKGVKAVKPDGSTKVIVLGDLSMNLDSRVLMGDIAMVNHGGETTVVADSSVLNQWKTHISKILKAPSAQHKACIPSTIAQLTSRIGASKVDTSLPMRWIDMMSKVMPVVFAQDIAKVYLPSIVRLTCVIFGMTNTHIAIAFLSNNRQATPSGPPKSLSIGLKAVGSVKQSLCTSSMSSHLRDSLQILPLSNTMSLTQSMKLVVQDINRQYPALASEVKQWQPPKKKRRQRQGVRFTARPQIRVFTS